MTAPTPPRTEQETRAESKLARSALLGAVFLMATSAIGPGFITQTATFTVQLGAAFACAIVLSVVVDIAVQLNVWRVIGVSGLRAHELGNRVLPGVGYLLAGLVVLGGLVFNVGNIAGSGLGAEAMFGLDPRIGGALSALLAIGIFVSKKAGLALDRAVIGLGVLMILATLVIVITSDPPVGEALVNVVRPEQFSFLAVTTIIGGTVGGYITYAGAHRMLDSGRTGPGHVARDHPQLRGQHPGHRPDARAAVPGHPRRRRRAARRSPATTPPAAPSRRRPARSVCACTASCSGPPRSRR